MRGERQLLRLGEYLVRRACQRLPQDIREERYREWAAELPAILDDPQIRPAPRRAVRMLGFAADTFRGTVPTPARARHLPPGMTAVLCLLLIAGLAGVALVIWPAVRAPGHGLNYALLAFALLIVAFPISMLVRSAERVTALISVSATVAGVVFFLGNAAHAPGDWVNYFGAGWLLLLFLAEWLASRWARTKRA